VLMKVSIWAFNMHENYYLHPKSPQVVIKSALI
jgi:hypothetical protein